MCSRGVVTVDYIIRMIHDIPSMILYPGTVLSVLVCSLFTHHIILVLILDAARATTN